MHGAEATERRERAEERDDAEDVDPPNYFSFFFLWMLLILINIGEAGVTFKREHWDTLTSTEKEEMEEATYQWLKPRIERAVARIDARQDDKAAPAPAAPPVTAQVPAVSPPEQVEAPPVPPPTEAALIAPPPVIPPTVVKSTEVWRPLNYPSVPLAPFPGAAIGPKPKGHATEKKP